MFLTRQSRKRNFEAKMAFIRQTDWCLRQPIWGECHEHSMRVRRQVRQSHCLHAPLFRPCDLSRLPAHHVRLGYGRIALSVESEKQQSESVLARKLPTREESCHGDGQTIWTTISIPRIQHRQGCGGATTGAARWNPARPGLYLLHSGTLSYFFVCVQQAGPGSAPADSGPTRKLPPSSTRAIDPPPAPTV